MSFPFSSYVPNRDRLVQCHRIIFYHSNAVRYYTEFDRISHETRRTRTPGDVPWEVSSYRNKRDDKRAFGARVAEYLRQPTDTDTLLELLNTAQEKRWAGALAVLEDLIPTSYGTPDIALCANCGDTWVARHGGDTVHIDGGYVGECCLDEYVECSDTDGYVLRDDAYQAFTDSDNYGAPCDPEWFASARTLVELNEYYQTDGVEYITRRVYEHLGWTTEYGDGAEPYRYEDEDEDEDDGYSERAGYHGSSIRSRSYFSEPAGASKRNIPIGMELELYSTGSVRDALESQSLGWIVERDGSLDGTYGHEIVSPPLLRSAWEEIVPDLMEALTEENSVAYTAPSANHTYGIHLTVNRKYLTELGIYRMILFLRSRDNAGFVRAVAQRWQIYGESLNGMGTCHKDEKVAHACGGLSECYSPARNKSDRKISGTGKMSCLNLKTDKYGTELAEFRIFQATLEPNRVLKNIEFVHALIEWANQPYGLSRDHSDFCAWLAHQRKVYPHLHAYLVEKGEYRVKGSSAAIPNTWRDLLLTNKQKAENFKLAQAA